MTGSERDTSKRLKVVEEIFDEVVEQYRHALIDDATMSALATTALYAAGSRAGNSEFRAEEATKLLLRIEYLDCPETRRTLWSAIVVTVMWTEKEQYAHSLFNVSSAADGAAAFEATDEYLKNCGERSHAFLPHVINLVRRYHDCSSHAANRIMGSFIHFIARFGTSEDLKKLFAPL